ncbi:palmitoyl-CoA hydrolase [Dactylonectria estremocensis]|uniref:Palmitoyl-CoA hydrolase n=1 Tax=Dactylonectria estremocensis TaxID=1079267 RepID=A0A9P9ESM8_9HYPO|nr:palmitoyl-CoA hydrolase [Dactylonectria estremocensis]
MLTHHPDPSKHPRSQMERVLSLCRLKGKCDGSDSFSNQEPLQCAPWARGAYGGQLVAQSLVAAYETVSSHFVAHSIHCHFLRAANVDMSIIYHVDRVRDGKSFATRVVSAKQGQRVILLATTSFTQDTETSNKKLKHASPMPQNVPRPDDRPKAVVIQSAAGQGGHEKPCDCVRSVSETKGPPGERRLRQWTRARGRMGETTPLVANADMGETKLTNTNPGQPANHPAHLAALTYMTDNYFIGTVFRVHNASRFSNRSTPHAMLSTARGNSADDKSLQVYFDALVEEEKSDNRQAPINDKRVEMMVTLDHTIFFHQPRGFRADEWLLSEMESPWADDERGIVVQRIWSQHGTLVATAIQEGIVRLYQHNGESRL